MDELHYYICISIHALREEGDLHLLGFMPIRWIFLSTPSARRATWLLISGWGTMTISIHALREEGDHKGNNVRIPHSGISIHALREEGDWMQRWP